jgi:hypothetical protein
MERVAEILVRLPVHLVVVLVGQILRIRFRIQVGTVLEVVGLLILHR